MINCPRCQSASRVWLRSGVFVDQSDPGQPEAHGGLYKAALVVCNDCGLIELYDRSAGILDDIPQGPPSLRKA